MENENKNQPIQITPRKITDPGEAERILMQYAGIFPRHIKEFAEKIAKKEQTVKNYSR